MLQTKFKAIHKKTKETYWFDLMWGNKQNVGNGYIAMLPLGVELKQPSITYPDNRIGIDPNDCEIEFYDSAELEQNVVSHLNTMAEESLSPETLEKWEAVLRELKQNRKSFYAGGQEKN